MSNKTSNIICIVLTFIFVGCISSILSATPGCRSIINDISGWR
jgi:hypothetical protein